jgi:hypothetical protein
LPFLSDSGEHLDEMVKTAKGIWSDFVLVGALTLFGNKPAGCKTLYYKFLEKHYPELVPKYKSLFRIFFQPMGGYQKELEEKSMRLCER